MSGLGSHIGFVNVWISASSGFVLCVSGHSHRKSVGSPVLFFVSCLGAHARLRFLRLLDLFCASEAIAVVVLLLCLV